MTIYRVCKVERHAQIHYSSRKTREAVEEAMWETDGETFEDVATFGDKAEAEVFAASIDTAPFTRYSPAHVCWTCVAVVEVEVDEDGEEEWLDESRYEASVDDIMCFVDSVEKDEEEEE